MKLNYNTELKVFIQADELPEFIVVDEEFRNKYKYYNPLILSGRVIKVWKSGNITGIKNNKLKIVQKDINGRSELYWKSKNKYSYYLVALIIFDVYEKQFPDFIKTEFQEGFDFSGISYIDGDNQNISIRNLKKHTATNIGSALFEDINNYFVSEFNIPNDSKMFNLKENPIKLDRYSDLLIFQNGKIIDERGLSSVRLNEKGYETISYRNKNLSVHRLVAEAFVKKSNQEYNVVNHIDGDKTNNNYNNLEWTNNTLNTLHGEILKEVNIQKKIRGGEFDYFQFKGLAYGSENFRDFIKNKIETEYSLDKEMWLFSSSTPLFLLYLPFSKIYGDKWPINLMVRSLSNQIAVTFFGQDNPLYEKYFVPEKFNSTRTYWFIVNNINKYLSINKDGHLIDVLNSLGVDVDLYIKWLFYDLKTIIDDDLGFSFHQELLKYIGILSKSNPKGIFVNDIIEGFNLRKRNYIPVDMDSNILLYTKSGKSTIKVNLNHRVIEDFNSLYFNDKKKAKINGDILFLFMNQTLLYNLNNN